MRWRSVIFGAVAPWAAAFSWAAAQPAPAPFAIGEGLFYVGDSDIAAYLIRTPAGLVLIDGGYESTAPLILANIRRLGFEPRQVKILLNTHAHLDHAGGLAALKAATGATLYASAEDGALMARGGKGDFAFGDGASYPPVTPDRILKDREMVELGGVRLTARLTPGHTRGCTTWTFPVVVAGQTRQALVLCSNSILGNYSLKPGAESYPGIARDYAHSYEVWRTTPCEVFLASHARMFGMAAKRAALAAGKPDAFVDPQGCRAYFERGEAGFKRRLEAER